MVLFIEIKVFLNEKKFWIYFVMYIIFRIYIRKKNEKIYVMDFIENGYYLLLW